MPSLDPPLPIAATISLATDVLSVTFDQPLQPGPSNENNWDGVCDFIVGIRDFDVFVPLTIVGSTVTGVVVAQLAPVPPPSVVNYSAVAPDVKGLTGVPVAPFADFPLTAIP